MSLQGGKGGLLDALAESDELYQRLLGLKQKYAQAEQELGPHSTSLRTRGELPFAFNNIAGVEAAAGAGLAELGDDKSRDQSKLKARRNVRMRSRSDSACMFINGIQLQALMRKLISQIGSCHVDTILRSSVVSVLFSLISETFLRENSRLSLFLKSAGEALGLLIFPGTVSPVSHYFWQTRTYLFIECFRLRES
jgi:hypothetical protein